MNRPIEFRVWDGEKLHYPPAILFNSFAIFWQYSKEEPIYSTGERGYVQQFTGLLDKNGKKIFEGDIVECCFNMRQDKKNLGIIKFCEKYGNMGVLITDAQVHVNAQNVPKPFFNFITNSGELLVEVIGNIFENPELLQ